MYGKTALGLFGPDNEHTYVEERYEKRQRKEGGEAGVKKRQIAAHFSQVIYYIGCHFHFVYSFSMNLSFALLLLGLLSASKSLAPIAFRVTSRCVAGRGSSWVAAYEDLE